MASPFFIGLEIERLQTARLVLRELCDDDVDALSEALANFNVSRYTSSIPHPYLRSHAIDFIARQKSKTSASVKKVVALKANPKGLVGSVRLHIDPVTKSCELGYWIAEPYWGQGFATEAAARLVEHAFTALKFSIVSAAYDSDNPASACVLMRLGFIETGTCEGFSVAQNKLVPGKLMELTKSRWQSRGS